MGEFVNRVQERLTMNRTDQAMTKTGKGLERICSAREDQV